MPMPWLYLVILLPLITSHQQAISQLLPRQHVSLKKGESKRKISTLMDLEGEMIL